MSRFLKRTNRGILFGAMCLLLAPLACQVREAGEQRIEVIPPVTTFSVKAIQLSDKMNDYGFELSWTGNYPVRIVKSYPWKSDRGEVMESNEEFKFDAGTNQFVDKDREELVPGTPYTFYINPQNPGDPQPTPANIEITLPKDLGLSRKFILESMGTDTVHQLKAQKAYFDNDTIAILGGEYRITAEQFYFGTDGKIEMIPCKKSTYWFGEAQKITKGFSEDAFFKQCEIKPQLRLFVRQGLGKLTLATLNPSGAEFAPEAFIEVEDDRKFSLEIQNVATPRSLKPVIKARLGGRSYRYENGEMKLLDKEIGIYHDRGDKEVPYYFVAFDGDIYPIKKSDHGTSGFFYQPTQSRLFSKPDDLPGANYQKLTIQDINDPQLPTALNRLVEAHRLAMELNSKLVGHGGFTVEFFFSENRYAFSDEQIRFLEYLIVHVKEFAQEMAKTKVKRVVVTNDQNFSGVPAIDLEQSRLEITSKLPRTAKDNYDLALKAMRDYVPGKHTYR